MKNNVEKNLLSDRKTRLKAQLKRLPLLLVPIFAVIGSIMVIRRELWFDEALTLLNFVLPLTPAEIYNSYLIPNNQIVYSIMLNIWNGIGEIAGVFYNVTYWRMLSIILATAALMIFVHLREKIDRKLYPAVLVLCTAATSAIFVNYATALRGYAASWLFVMLALYGLYNVFHEKASQGWGCYTIAAILAAGTVPTNILALAAVVLYAVPWMKEKFWCDKRFYIAAAVVPLALILFYAPIAGKFLATFKLGEGFPSRNGALVMVLGMYIASFGILLLFAPWGIEKKPWQHTLRYLIWFFPAMAIILLHRAPFPRVFVTLLPVVAMLVTDGIAKVVEKDWKKWHLALFFMISTAVQLLLFPTGVLLAEKARLNPVDDDFFRPYYMEAGYKPCAAIQEIENHTYGNSVFFSFNSDPYPLFFYAVTNNIDTKKYALDVPYNSVKFVPNGSFAVLAESEDPQTFEKRFNCQLNEIKKFGRLKLYRMTRKLPQALEGQNL